VGEQLIAEPRHVTVIGAGVVGVAAALTLQRDGHRVTVIDRLAPGQATSFGNAGGMAVTEMQPASVPGTIWKVPGWLADPEGPLAIRPAYLPRLVPWLWRFWRAGTWEKVTALADAQAALNDRARADWQPLLAAAKLTDQLKVNGALALYRDDSGYRADALSWQLRRERGVEIHSVGPDEIRQLEPDIGPGFARGVLMPDWGHVLDPERIVAGMAAHFTGDGGEIIRAEVTGLVTEAGEFERGWVRALQTTLGERSVDWLVICAGAWSHKIAAWLGDTVPLESERGYHVTLPAAPVALRRMVIVGEDHFVMTPMSMGLRIAGTVEMGGLDGAPNMARARVLLDKARRVLPALAGVAAAQGKTEWSGHRPALPDTIPVISAAPGFANVFYGFGHGHLGLTQAAVTGRILADLLGAGETGIDVSAYRVERF
jgi:D-amino-acid dehydrogenase